jgi:enamine deaminase RidA (YjgF/YER057c/UK114 family)
MLPGRSEPHQAHRETDGAREQHSPFTEQHLVANGASELFAEVFGNIGLHVRSAFGVAQIPFGSCVEIELVVELL